MRVQPAHPCTDSGVETGRSELRATDTARARAEGSANRTACRTPRAPRRKVAIPTQEVGRPGQGTMVSRRAVETHSLTRRSGETAIERNHADCERHRDFGR